VMQIEAYFEGKEIILVSKWIKKGRIPTKGIKRY
jgi:hypothetical protein